MGGVVLIVVMALPLEAALVLLWFGPLRSEDTRPPGQSSFWRFRPQNPEHESVDVTARDDLYASNKKPGETGAFLQHARPYVVESRQYFLGDKREFR